MASIFLNTINPEMAGISYNDALGALLVTLSSADTTRLQFGVVYLDLDGIGFPTAERAEVLLSAGLGGFTFPGGSFDPGEVPLNHVVGLAVQITRPDTSTFNVITVDRFSLLYPDISELALLAGDDRIDGGNAGDGITGYGGRDVLNGNDGDDRLEGGSGNDTLLGGQGDDRLLGGGGRDVLKGEFGRDVLTGGGGADDFDFAGSPVFGAPPGGVGQANRDVVTDFQRGIDDLVLTGYAGTLTFVGANAFTGGLQVRAVQRAEGVLVQVNLDGTTAPEFEILLRGLSGPLAATDLIL
jgi:hypothetical protein